MTHDCAYAEVAARRAKELPGRLGFAVFIGMAAWTFVGGKGAVIWFVAVVISQGIDAVIADLPRRRAEQGPPAWFPAIYSASAFICGAIYSSACAYTWFDGGLPGKVFGILTPAGALLNVCLVQGRAPRVMLAGWLPHLFFLVGMPIAYALLTPGQSLTQWSFVSMGAALYVAHVFMAVGRINESTRTMRAASDLADQERLRAERANEAKSDFLATMSHEIRTPMNAVVAAAGLLGRTRLTEEQAEHVAMLTNGSQMLMGLLNDVLDLAKIESGKLTIETAKTRLIDKLQASVHLWRPQAELKGVQFHFEPGDLPAVVMTDPLRLQQIVFNLVSNAVKFTDQGSIVLRGGRIAADVPDAPARFWIEVADTGRGIDEAAVQRVFESFEQGSTRTSASVLLAEDHPVNQRIVQLILEPLGFHLTVAANGAEAVAAAQTQAFDLILMDMQMPVMGGVEATRQIRGATGPNRSTTVLAFTANAMEEHRAEWAAVGVDVFLTKPVDLQGLVRAVQAALPAGPADSRAA